MRFKAYFLSAVIITSMSLAVNGYTYSCNNFPGIPLLFDNSLLFTDSDQVNFLYPADPGIKESVPRTYLARYERWKSDLLATDYGRELWKKYENNQKFQLRIIVSGGRKSGAGTDEYKWNENGELIGATIYLGKDLDKGIPDPVYYPVMNSLSSAQIQLSGSGSILAAAKLAHEIGHVNNTAQINGKLFQQQNKLINNYYSIFLKNGHNATDPRLLELVEELGAKPIEVWEDREYWSEVSAMHYLVERLHGSSTYCTVVRKIRSNIRSYAVNYSDRFADIPSSTAQAVCAY